MRSPLTAPAHLRLFFHDGMFDERKVPEAAARRAAAEESWQRLTRVPNSAQLELFCPPYNPT